MKKQEFWYKGIRYFIDNSRNVDSIGDFEEYKGVVLVDKSMPEKFLVGIAIHEIEERRFIRRGYSYEQAHMIAQKKELEYYQEISRGSFEKGLEMLKEEERFVLGLFLQRTKDEIRALKEGFVKVFVENQN